MRGRRAVSSKESSFWLLTKECVCAEKNSLVHMFNGSFESLSVDVELERSWVSRVLTTEDSWSQEWWDIEGNIDGNNGIQTLKSYFVNTFRRKEIKMECLPTP